MKFQGTERYIATDDLRMAVNAAVALERPLLIEGEPGTGKTMLVETFLKGINASEVAARRIAVSNYGAADLLRAVAYAYGIDAANEYDPIVEDIYDFCEAQEIDIDTISTYHPQSDEIDQRLPSKIASDIGDTIGGTIVTTVCCFLLAVNCFLKEDPFCRIRGFSRPEFCKFLIVIVIGVCFCVNGFIVR